MARVLRFAFWPRLREGYRPEEIQGKHTMSFQWPRSTLRLAYYYANKSEFDEAIDTGARLAAESQAAAKSVVSRESLLGRMQKQSSGPTG